MPDTSQQEVTLKLSVDTADGSKAMQTLAKDTKAAGDAADKSQRQFDAHREALKRLQSQAKEKAIQAEVEHISAARQPWWNRSVGSAGSAMSVIRSGAGLGVAGALVYGAGQATDRLGQEAAWRHVNTGGRMGGGDEADAFLRAIPAIGQAAQAMESLSRSLAGLKAAAMMAEAGLTVESRQLSASRFEAAQRAGAAGTLYGAGIHAADTQASRDAASNYYQSLTPGRLEEFRGAFGGGKEAAAQAQAALDAARAGLVARDQVHDATVDDIAGRRPGVADAVARADELQRRRERLTAAKEAWPNEHGWFDRWASKAAGWVNPALNQHGAIEGDETNAAKEANSAQMKAAEKQQQLAEKLAQSQQQIADIEAQRVKVAEAELAYQRALVAVKQQVAQGAQGRATKYGLGTQADAAEDENLLRIIKRHGIGALTPEQAQRAYAIPGAAEILQSRVNARGDEIGKGVRGALADLAPEGDRAQILKPLAQQQDEIRKLLAEAQSDAAAKTADAAKGWGAALADAVAEAMRNAIGNFRAELKAKQNEEIIRKNGT